MDNYALIRIFGSVEFVRKMVECVMTLMLPPSGNVSKQTAPMQGNPRNLVLMKVVLVVNSSPFVTSFHHRHGLVIHICYNPYLAKQSIAQERARALHCHDRLIRREGFVASCGGGGGGGAGAAGLLHDFDVVGGCGDV